MAITLSRADYQPLWQTTNPSSSLPIPLPGYREWQEVISAPGAGLHSAHCYANQSRFAAAFRKQFGVNPKTYLLGRTSG